jgi:hypothetical protein
MSSLKRWRRLKQGQFHKWDTPGDQIQGIWQGAHEGRYGLLGTLETGEQVLTFPLHVALQERLRRIPYGARIQIRYTGLETSSHGRLFKGFDVVAEGDDTQNGRDPATDDFAQPMEDPR